MIGFTERQLLRRTRVLLGVFILGLLISGATALPLMMELEWMVDITGAGEMVEAPGSTTPPAWATWLVRVNEALREVGQRHAFLFYGTDWLAFGHIVIAIAFVGAWRDPVRNRWLIDFGLIACTLVIPWALILGAVRGIPIGWRIIDCSFGVFGAVPLGLCRKYIRHLESPKQSRNGQ